MIKALIFDFDGVVVDSERIHLEAFNTIMKPYGKCIGWEEYVETYMGFDDRDCLRLALPEMGSTKIAELIKEKAVVFENFVKEGHVQALPGAVDLIKLASKTIPTAICSGALKEDILPILDRLEISDAFDVIVTSYDTPISKPDPAPYKKAWQKLCEKFQELSAPQCACTIEDTPAGISSAKGAGLNVLAVTNSYDTSFLSQADAIVDSLEEITIEKLSSLI